MTISKACLCGPYLESQLMDSLNPESLPPVTVTPIQRLPRIWKFWGTALWGLFIFAAMFVGQLAVVGWFLLRQEGPLNMAAAVHVQTVQRTMQFISNQALLGTRWKVQLRLRLNSAPRSNQIRWNQSMPILRMTKLSIPCPIQPNSTNQNQFARTKNTPATDWLRRVDRRRILRLLSASRLRIRMDRAPLPPRQRDVGAAL